MSLESDGSLAVVPGPISRIPNLDMGAAALQGQTILPANPTWPPIRTVQPLKDCSRGSSRLGCSFRFNLRRVFFSIFEGLRWKLEALRSKFQGPEC